MSFLDYLSPALTATTQAVSGAQAGQGIAKQRQQQDLMEALKLRRQQEQDAQTRVLQVAQGRHLDAETNRLTAPPAPKRTYDATRGAIVDETTGIAAPVTNLPPKARTIHQQALNPLDGTIENVYSDGSREVVRKATPAEIRKATYSAPDPITVHAAERDYDVKHPLAPRAGGEDQNVAATRRDLKGFQSQQIRAEHDVTATKSDIARLLRDHPRASQPLAAQRTAVDSSFANQATTMQGQLTDAEQRKARLTHSADSTQSVLNTMRAAPAGAPPPVALSPAPVAAPFDKVERARAETAGFQDALAGITDPAKRTAAMRIYNERMMKVNAGVDPDGE